MFSIYSTLFCCFDLAFPFPFPFLQWQRLSGVCGCVCVRELSTPVGSPRGPGWEHRWTPGQVVGRGRGGVAVPEVPDRIQAREQVAQSMLLTPLSFRRSNPKTPAMFTHGRVYWPISWFLPEAWPTRRWRHIYYKNTIWRLSVLLNYI